MKLLLCFDFLEELYYVAVHSPSTPGTFFAKPAFTSRESAYSHLSKGLLDPDKFKTDRNLSSKTSLISEDITNEFPELLI
jgi:hypothetical protein